MIFLGIYATVFTNTPTESGFVDIELHFKTPLADNITVVLYATYDEVVEIDWQSQVKIV